MNRKQNLQPLFNGEVEGNQYMKIVSLDDKLESSSERKTGWNVRVVNLYVTEGTLQL